jgi:hypothetical protein
MAITTTDKKTKRKQMVYPKPSTGTGKTYYTKNDLSKAAFNKAKSINILKTEINSTKINTLLNSLTEAEFMYLSKTIDLAQNFKDLIKYYNLSKERFCEEMKISKDKYNSYIKGSRNYDLRDIARLQGLSLKLKDEKEQADKNPKSPVEYAEESRIKKNK